MILGVTAGVVYAHFGGPSNASSATGIDLQKGLIGWWKLDGNAKDATPYGHDGTTTNTSLAADRKGAANKALSFNGTNSSIDTGLTTNIDTFTFSLWVYQTKSGTYQTPLSNTRDCCGTGYHGFELETSYTGNNVLLKLWKSDGTSISVAGGTTNLNSWVFFSGSFDGTNLSVYKNGTLVATNSAYSGTIGMSTTTLKIGQMGTSTAGFFGGSIDDVRLYNRALSATEIRALYDTYDANVKINSGESGLLGWWKLDGNTKDSTPYANNGNFGGPSSPTVTVDRKGKAGGAYAFSGTPHTGNFITNFPQARYNIGVNQKRTVSAWFKGSSQPYNAAIVYNSGSCIGWNLYLNANGDVGFNMTVGDNGCTGFVGSSAISSGTNYADNSWHYAAVALDRPAGSMQLYVDGTLKATNTLDNTKGGDNNSDLRIGTDWNDGQPFAGSIDDVRYYSRALSAQDIRQQYASYNSQINLNAAPSSSPTLNLNSGLVGLWPFNGNAKDATPYGNNGIVSNAALVADRKGRANSAYYFDSTSVPSWINVGNPATFANLTNSGFTYSIWLERDAASSYRWPIIMGASNSHVYYAIRSQNYGDTITFEYGTSPYDGAAGHYNNIGMGTLPTGSWHLYTVTYDGATIKTYKDGAFVSQATVSLDTVFGGISYTTSGVGNGFMGSMDEPRVYNRVLSAAEAQALYTSYR